MGKSAGDGRGEMGRGWEGMEGAPGERAWPGPVVAPIVLCCVVYCAVLWLRLRKWLRRSVSVTGVSGCFVEIIVANLIPESPVKTYRECREIWNDVVRGQIKRKIIKAGF